MCSGKLATILPLPQSPTAAQLAKSASFGGIASSRSCASHSFNSCGISCLSKIGLARASTAPAPATAYNNSSTANGEHFLLCFNFFESILYSIKPILFQPCFFAGTIFAKIKNLHESLQDVNPQYRPLGDIFFRVYRYNPYFLGTFLPCLSITILIFRNFLTHLSIAVLSFRNFLPRLSIR